MAIRILKCEPVSDQRCKLLIHPDGENAIEYVTEILNASGWQVDEEQPPGGGLVKFAVGASATEVLNAIKGDKQFELPD